MAKKEKDPRRSLPPCPDPGLYILVKTRERWYWRRRRTDTTLNSSFAANVAATRITSPAAKRVIRSLEEYMRGLSAGRLQARLSSKLRTGFIEKGSIDYGLLKGFEFQAEHPLDRILLSQYTCMQEGGELVIQVPVRSGTVKQYNSLVTHFYFEAVLLYGDVLEDELLKVEYALSKPYDFTGDTKSECKLVLPIPEKGRPWMLLLKVSCLEGNEMAAHPKHYGMRVVETGN